MNVTCDNCQEDFEPKEKERYLGAMITEKYIVCPHCGKKHIITLNNSLTRKLERNINSLKSALSSKELNGVFRTCLNVALKNNINFHRQAMSLLMKSECLWRYKA